MCQIRSVFSPMMSIISSWVVVDSSSYSSTPPQISRLVVWWEMSLQKKYTLETALAKLCEWPDQVHVGIIPRPTTNPEVLINVYASTEQLNWTIPEHGAVSEGGWWAPRESFLVCDSI